VQNNEIALYTNAINEFRRWQNNPCLFTLEPVIASTYNLSYDGAPFCGSPLNSLFGGPPVPAESYFTAYGMRKSYAAPTDQFPYFSSLVAKTAVNLAEVAGIAAAAWGVIAAVTTAVLAENLAVGLAAFIAVGFSNRPLRGQWLLQ
jgi:hypothetical protein